MNECKQKKTKKGDNEKESEQQRYVNGMKRENETLEEHNERKLRIWTWNGNFYFSAFKVLCQT